MKSTAVRDAFINYFETQDHKHLGSSSVVPHGDPTLLFTNAGMNQFKNVFLGLEPRSYARAVSSQKCIRAGGKHNDLDNVGFTSRHHTFFEMLGNFSFGDYFKEEAIYFCWDLLTNVYGLPKDKLWITIYEEDDDAGRIWKKVSGLSSDRIVKMGKKDNFWSMGDTGPCGPCSEVHIDQGEKSGCGVGCKLLDCECDRFLELWNLVFMQYNCDENGEINSLPSPSIDTGMGLERVSAILQEVDSNYDTDLIMPIIESIVKITGHRYSRDDAGTPFRVIADHVRALTFALTDGAYPSNEGRGYVLRKILRRAFRFGLKLGIEEPFLYKIADDVSSLMGGVYPELIKKADQVKGIILNEEKSFMDTLSDGMKRVDEIIELVKKKNQKFISGKHVFKLYDTYGIPIDMIEDIAHDEHLQIEKETFLELMEKQRGRARSAKKANFANKDKSVYDNIKDALQDPIAFKGYGSFDLSTKVVALIKNGESVDVVSEGDKIEVVLQNTPFYAESGGQVADKGEIRSGSALLKIYDTILPVNGIIVHLAKVTSGVLKIFDKVSASIDRELRSQISKHHSATHLLHYALRTVLGDHVQQAGSQVECDRLRFDFAHFKALTDNQIEQVTKIINNLIQDNLTQKTEVQSIKEAKESGAMALFGEKYSERVRVVSFGDVSKELCGGTHVGATGEIGSLFILNEGSVATGIRRIEAICGKAAMEHALSREKLLKDISNLLSAPAPQLKDRVEKLLDEKRNLEKNLRDIQAKQGLKSVDEFLKDVKVLDGVNVLSKNCGKMTKDMMRKLGDAIKDKIGTGIISLGAQDGGSCIFLVMVTPDLVKKGYHAGNLVKKLAETAGGRGGGRPDMAQAGAKDVSRLESALGEFINLI